ncbi:MAG: hypothetical protein AVDCRST_MAG56-2411 [uncultured Cytophagales bacterium]|uniref:Uncharacterized protein n=1 Tax=uncultured Cytophagales bacterium TaxID=158755 RepID=A0A6J4IPZ3_9SPHI|nr:MAG: hypothetical protein AVDCRST_MAG56-2411 [uncultured Cytophagales bacterium]
MCDIGTVILAESKRSGISAADFGKYLARGAARPATRTDFPDARSVTKREKAKSSLQHTGHRWDDELYPCP